MNEANALRIDRYANPGASSVNTYWIELQTSVIVIDAQRSLSQARLALHEIQKLGKPIRAIFLTHPHPDHFGGLGVFAEAASGIPIYPREKHWTTMNTTGKASLLVA